MLIINDVELYSPKRRGKFSIIILPPKIVKISREFPEELSKFFEIREINGEGMIAVPGIIDQHVHINGAGGEGGAKYRTPPIPMHVLSSAGITSVVGLLGTDGVARSLRELLMKARSLTEEGISSWIYTGAYQMPSPTITGGVLSDIVLLPEVIGVKICMSDHRSSHPTKEEILKVASEAHTGSVLTGKAGVVHIHVGKEKTGLKFLKEIVEETDIPIETFAPTHMNRTEEVLEEGIEFGRMGGYIDFTTGMPPEYYSMGAIEPAEAVKIARRRGVPIERITFSSDGNGSMPRFNERGEVTKVEIGRVDLTLKQFRKLVLERIVSVEDAIRIVSTNVADHLELHEKGRLEEGKDADILLLDKESLELRYVISRGEILVENGKVVKFATFYY